MSLESCPVCSGDYSVEVDLAIVTTFGIVHIRKCVDKSCATAWCDLAENRAWQRLAVFVFTEGDFDNVFIFTERSEAKGFAQGLIYGAGCYSGNLSAYVHPDELHELREGVKAVELEKAFKKRLEKFENGDIIR